jgi:hypothetical protein
VWWRDVFVVQRGCEDLVVNRNQIATVRQMAELSSPGDVRRFMGALMETADYLRRNVNVRLAIEALLLKLPSAA